MGSVSREVDKILGGPPVLVWRLCEEIVNAKMMGYATNDGRQPYGEGGRVEH